MRLSATSSRMLQAPRICPAELKVARHPSETAEFLWTRVLAYCLEYGEGIAFYTGKFSLQLIAGCIFFRQF